MNQQTSNKQSLTALPTHNKKPGKKGYLGHTSSSKLKVVSQVASPEIKPQTKIEQKQKQTDVDNQQEEEARRIEENFNKVDASSIQHLSPNETEDDIQSKLLNQLLTFAKDTKPCSANRSGLDQSESMTQFYLNSQVQLRLGKLQTDPTVEQDEAPKAPKVQEELPQNENEVEEIIYLNQILPYNRKNNKSRVNKSQERRQIHHKVPSHIIAPLKKFTSSDFQRSERQLQRLAEVQEKEAELAQLMAEISQNRYQRAQRRNQIYEVLENPSEQQKNDTPNEQKQRAPELEISVQPVEIEQLVQEQIKNSPRQLQMKNDSEQFCEDQHQSQQQQLLTEVTTDCQVLREISEDETPIVVSQFEPSQTKKLKKEQIHGPKQLIKAEIRVKCQQQTIAVHNKPNFSQKLLKPILSKNQNCLKSPLNRPQTTRTKTEKLQNVEEPQILQSFRKRAIISPKNTISLSQSRHSQDLHRVTASLTTLDNIQSSTERLDQKYQTQRKPVMNNLQRHTNLVHCDRELKSSEALRRSFQVKVNVKKKSQNSSKRKAETYKTVSKQERAVLVESNQEFVAKSLELSVDLNNQRQNESKVGYEGVHCSIIFDEGQIINKIF